MKSVKEVLFEYTDKSKNLTAYDVKTGNCTDNNLTKCTIDFKFTLDNDWDSEVLIM